MDVEPRGDPLPLVTVITIAYNARGHIEQTIRSVVSQTYPHKEYVVVDGGSSDGTVDIIKKYSTQTDRWLSEPDEGISDAMNKGLELASGDWILFLHADDYLASEESLARAIAMLDDDIDILACSIYFKDGGTLKLIRPHGWDFRMNFKVGLWHQAILCRKRLFDLIGTFDKSFKICMDYDFLLRAFRGNAKTKIIDLPLSVMNKTGISSQTDRDSFRARFSEERRVQEKNCRSRLLAAVYKIYWPLYRTYNFFHGRY
ncbi:MAG: glycosyltransferase family 2 protein [Acidiferrobacterales bacterium]